MIEIRTYEQSKTAIRLLVYMLLLIFFSSCQSKTKTQNKDFDRYVKIDITTNENWNNWLDQKIEPNERLNALSKAIWRSGIVTQDPDQLEYFLLEWKKFAEQSNTNYKSEELLYLNYILATLRAVPPDNIIEEAERKIKDLAGDEDIEAYGFLNLILSEHEQKEGISTNALRDNSQSFLDKISDTDKNKLKALYAYNLAYINEYLGEPDSVIIGYYEEAKTYFKSESIMDFYCISYNEKAILLIVGGQPEEGYRQLEEVVEVCLEHGFFSTGLLILSNIGYFHQENKNYDKATPIYEKIIEFCKGNDIEDAFANGVAHHHYISIKLAQKDILGAIDLANENLINTEKGPHSDLKADCHLSLITILNKINVLDSALYHGYKALDYLSEKTDSFLFSSTTEQLSETFRLMEKVDSALYYINKSLDYNVSARENGYKLIMRGELFLQKGFYKKASQDFMTSQEIGLEVKEDSLTIMSYLGLGKVQLSLGRLERAILESNRALTANVLLGHLPFNATALETIATANELNKNYQASIENRLQLEQIRLKERKGDHGLDVDMIKTAYLQKHNMIKNDQLLAEQEVKAIEQSRKVILYSSIILLLLCGLAVAIYLLRRHNNQLALLKIETQKKKDYQSHLSALSTQKRRLIANIAHDIRTPLNLLQNPLTEVIEQKSSSKRTNAKVIEHSLASTRTLINLVDQMKDLAKLQGAADHKPQLKRTNISQFLFNACSIFGSHAAQRRISLSSSLPSEPLWVEIDESSMTRVINNLLSNAIKYTNEYGRVNLSLVITDDEFSIAIQDNGIGMSASEIDQVFARYRQLNRTKEDNVFQPGGLGLSVVYETVKFLGGRIAVDSKINYGTEFKISFPHGIDLKDIPDQSARITHSHVTISPKKENKRRNKPEKSKNKIPHILVVEDNQRLNQYLTDSLKKDNEYELSNCLNGVEALNFCNRQVPDLIITDIVMPEMDGIELVKRLSRNEKTARTPIIFLSMLSDKQKIEEAYNSGVGLDYITKPVSIDLLKTKIKALLTFTSRLKKDTEKTADNAKFISLKPNATEQEKEFAKKVISIVTNHISDTSLTVDVISKKLLMSRTKFYAEVKEVMLCTPHQLIIRIRLEAAKKLLINGTRNIGEVAIEVGYTSASHFSRAFYKYHGMSPSGVEK